MKWEFLEPEQGYSRIRIGAEWEEIVSEYNDIVDGYAAFPVPGFRVGKAPRQVVEKRFHAQITDDLSRRCAQLFGREAIESAGSEAAGPLEVFDIECSRGKPLSFIARFIARPDFDLPDLQSIRIPEACEDPMSWLSHWLLEQVSMHLPDELVRGELAVDGVSASGPESAEWSAAAARVKLMLILKKIARREGIEVDESDIETRIKTKSADFGTTVEKLRAQLDQGRGRERLHEMLIAERTLEYLLEKFQK